jgi:hypothetical protein
MTDVTSFEPNGFLPGARRGSGVTLKRILDKIGIESGSHQPHGYFQWTL